MQKPPTWFIVVAVLALLWNALGLMAVVMDALTTPEQLAALPADQQALHQARPGWSVVGSFAAVVAGTLGSLALLLRKRWRTRCCWCRCWVCWCKTPASSRPRRQAISAAGLRHAGPGAGDRGGAGGLARRAIARDWLK